MSVKIFRAAAGLATVVLSAGAQAAFELNFQTPVSKVGERVYDLHTVILLICFVIFIAVFGTLLYSVFAHRKSKGHVAAQFHENTTVEVLWTIIPFVILVLIAWPATTTLLAMRDTAEPDVTVKVTGYQWEWAYDYLKGEGEGISFLSNLATPHDQIYGTAAKGEHYLREVNNPLVVPVGKKIRILTTANDVIHSWFVPELFVKQDANPGFIRDTWFRAEKEGTFRGQCAELCGKDHGFMPIVVEVVSPEKYSAWVAEQKKKMAGLADDPGKRATEAGEAVAPADIKTARR
ncbi:MAG: cytochrome c oxidase subunit II [Burkholderiales bacterium]|nr:cytochrome c oxidase subunit II [Burkholderiales bacterium]